MTDPIIPKNDGLPGEPKKLSEQGLFVYKAIHSQTDFLKKQQWTITNYVALIYGAVFAINSYSKNGGVPKILLIIAVALAGLVGSYSLIVIQRDLGKNRKRLDDVDDKIFGDEFDALEMGTYRDNWLKKRLPEGWYPYWRGAWFLAMLMAVIIVGVLIGVICARRP